MLSPRYIASNFLIAEIYSRLLRLSHLNLARELSLPSGRANLARNTENDYTQEYIEMMCFDELPIRETLHRAMKHRLAALCIGLASLDLPVLLTIEILLALGDSYERFTMHEAWKIGKLVKQSAMRLNQQKLQ